MIRNKVLSFSLYLVIIFTACASEKSTCPQLFTRSEKIYIPETVIDIKENLLPSNSCQYKFVFSSWKGIVNPAGEFLPSFKIQGELQRRGKVIYLLISQTKDTLNFFDFTLKKDDSVIVNLVTKSKNLLSEEIVISKKYKQKIDTSFFSKEIGGVVFKFRFCDFSFNKDGDDLVFYVNENIGVIGIYNSIFYAGTEWCASSIGKIDFMEIKKPSMQKVQIQQ